MLLVWCDTVASLDPERWVKETVGGLECEKGGFDEVTERAGMSLGSGVAVVDAGHGQQLFGGWSSNESSTTWGWNQTNTNGTALAGHLAGDGVGLAELGAPVAAADRADGKLGSDDGTTDGTGDLLGALGAKTKVAILIADGDDAAKSSALTGTGLLLDGHDLHDLVDELALGITLAGSTTKEVIDDLVLLDWDGVQEDLLERLDLVGGDETT